MAYRAGDQDTRDDGRIGKGETERDAREEWSTDHPLHGTDRPGVLPFLTVVLVLAAIFGIFALITWAMYHTG